MRSILNGLTLLAVTLPTATFAQTNCADRSLVVEKLASGYGETFGGGGLQNSNRVFEVWISQEKGTWTILMTKADGTSCIMASGTNWRDGMPDLKQPAGIKG
ncbi:MAG: hypothetical protein OXQ92_12615 [Boseongicola sp.]|nr:hypothetical protein [Boseongicola sp.]MDD9979366.1 hypothetical protein [Boseongicola sp.]